MRGYRFGSTLLAKRSLSFFTLSMVGKEPRRVRSERGMSSQHAA